MRHTDTTRFRVAICVAGVVLITPAVCCANTGVPMIFPTVIGMVVVLPLVILLETALAFRTLKLPFWSFLGNMTMANVLSTLFGIPLTWGVLFLLQGITGGGGEPDLSTFASKLFVVTWQSAYLTPSELEIPWVSPAKALALLVPFFFASWWIEYRVLKAILEGTDKKLLRKVVRNVNLVSYAGMALFVIADLLRAVGESGATL